MSHTDICIIQPFDFLVNPALFAGGKGDNELVDEQRTLSQALELFVHLHISNPIEVPRGSVTPSIFYESSLYSSSHGVGKDATPGLLSIYPLYLSTIELAHSVLQALNLDHCKEQLVSCEN